MQTARAQNGGLAVAAGNREGNVMAEHSNVARIKDGYAAFAKGDFAVLNDLFAEDILWHEPGQNQLSGVYRGRDAVYGFFGRLMELTEGSIRVDLNTVFADDDHGVALGADALQLSQAAEIDEILGRRKPELHHRDEAMPAGQHPRLVAELVHQGDGVRDGGRTMIFERSWNHGFLPGGVASADPSGVA